MSLEHQSVLLAPHQDDAALFSAYRAQRAKPQVVVVFRSVKQAAVGITTAEREAEEAAALRILGCPYEQWDFPDNAPEAALWGPLEQRIRMLANGYEVCYAPAVEEGGHEQHSLVGELALQAFGPERLRPYLTYRRGYGKTVGEEVVPTGDEIGRKLRALACYESQIREPSCRPWFVGDLREYVP